MWKIEVIDNWHIKLIAPTYIKNLFKYKSSVMTFVPWKRRYSYTESEDTLYLEETDDGYIFGIGWSSYLLYHYKDKFDIDSIRLLTEYDPLVVNIPELYDFQQDDLNKLLQFRRSLFQVFTGYGKTEIIALFTKWLLDNTKFNILVMCPNSKPLDTLVDRFSKFGYEWDYFNYESRLNIININGFPRSSWFDPESDYWKSIDIILADEVEYCCNDSGSMILELCTNYKRAYGFSATADVSKGEEITLRYGNQPIVQRNKTIINYFGFANIFKKPFDFKIKSVNIATTVFSEFELEYDAASEYLEVIYSLFTNDKFCEMLTKVILKEKGVFVPMVRLQVIDYWIENWFNSPGFICVNICSRGYELYDSGVYVGQVDAETINDMIKRGVLDVLTGTKSAFSALDIPDLNKVILLHSKVAGVVIQAIGRASRKKEFTIFSLVPYENVPMYSHDLKKRKELINNYFCDCKITQINKLETEYGI